MAWLLDKKKTDEELVIKAIPSGSQHKVSWHLLVKVIKDLPSLDVPNTTTSASAHTLTASAPCPLCLMTIPYYPYCVHIPSWTSQLPPLQVQSQSPSYLQELWYCCHTIHKLNHHTSPIIITKFAPSLTSNTVCTLFLQVRHCPHFIQTSSNTVSILFSQASLLATLHSHKLAPAMSWTHPPTQSPQYLHKLQTCPYFILRLARAMTPIHPPTLFLLHPHKL